MLMLPSIHRIVSSNNRIETTPIGKRADVEWRATISSVQLLTPLTPLQISP